MALPLFAVTLFVSAFLLFLVQPMIGKMILPKLGGTPQVWNTCMLFFQTALLAGYAYTHNISTRLATRRQLIVHAFLLLTPLAILLPMGPFNVRDWYPDPTGIAVVEALTELALVVGIPFFVVSTSAPLLQRWFTATGHPAARDPYFLYGASNFGSLLSLLLYPIFFEPWFALQTQAWIWLGGYVILIAMVALCIAMVWHSPLSLQSLDMAPEAEGLPEMPVPPPDAASPLVQTSTATRTGPPPMRGHGAGRKKGLKGPGRALSTSVTAEAPRSAPAALISRPSDLPVTWGRRVRWVLLAAVPSSLMLGVTSYISTDLAAVPFLWIIPLALYLLSFILVYLRWPIPWTSADLGSFNTPHALVIYILHPLAIIGLGWVLLRGGFGMTDMYIAWIAFFMTALACHGELARDRPNPRYLTEYFLLMSVGGALGGFLNAIIAPMLFPGVWEFYIAVCVACFVRPVLLESNWTESFLMNTFPGLRDWARDQSDQVSRSSGKEPDGSTYVLSYTFDVLLGAGLMALLVWFMHWQSDHGFYTPRSGAKLLKFLGFSDFAIRYYAGNAYWGAIYGIPLIVCGLYSTRPLRFGLAITVLFALTFGVYASRGEHETLFQGRTYFGVLRVLKAQESLVNDNGQPNDMVEFQAFAKPRRGEGDKDIYDYTYLMHGTTYHGRNYVYNPEKDAVDLSRLATTYYHRYGPVGFVMDRDNWLPGPQNTYWGDLRVPAGIVGDIVADLGMGTPPYHTLLNAGVSEPAYATIGLGTGTMASYCRPYQHLTFYEIDRQVREFSLPPKGNMDVVRTEKTEDGKRYRSFFTYLNGALRRGANLEIVMGDARLTMEHQKTRVDKNPDIALYPMLPADKRRLLPGQTEPLLEGDANSDFAVLPNSTMSQDRENYYHAIEVDAFSSDAIPVQMITLEAIRMYMTKIRHDGVVMVHTSNRHLDLVQPVARIVEVLDEEFMQEFKEGKRDAKYKHVKCLVAKDQDQRDKYLGHFSSEYVMVCYDLKYLKPAKTYAARPEYSIFDHSVVEWGAPKEVARYPWTDDFSNLIKILR